MVVGFIEDQTLYPKIWILFDYYTHNSLLRRMALPGLITFVNKMEFELDGIVNWKYLF